MAQTIVQDHGYDTVEKLSHLKPIDVDILIKTLCVPGREHADKTRDPGISVPHSAHQSFILACFILFHSVQCDFCLGLNLIDKHVVHDTDLQQVRESDHNNNLYCKD